jgi:hypothetical protein
MTKRGVKGFTVKAGSGVIMRRQLTKREAADRWLRRSLYVLKRRARRTPGNKMEDRMAEVLTPNSDRWDLFTNTLFRALHPNGDDNRSVCLGDSGPGVHRYAKEAMRDMGGIDITASLEFFVANVGHCDCEILLNVDAMSEG